MCWPAVRCLALLLSFVGAVYVACIGLTGWLLRDSGLAVLIPLVVIACVAEPVREWGQRLSNRLVFGTQLSPREAVRSLVERFSDDREADELTELTQVVVQSTRATEATIWLRRGLELSRLAGYPKSADPGARVALAAETLTAAQSALQPADCRPVSYEGELLGTLAVTTPRGVDVTPTESRLLDELSRHAGLLVANARLAVDLARELERVNARAVELQASRQQVVQAQDLQRRKLESDIHDGAQQQLVALLIQLGVLRRSDPAAAPRQLPALREVLTATEGTLRTLAAGGAPRILLDRGLRAALEEAADLARHGGVRVELDCPHGRLAPPEAETAVYFVCVEALQNVAKHAHATQVWTRAVDEADGLIFSVTDDGVGFAPDRSPDGSGLGHLSTRLTALGGRVEVETSPGRGTTVRGWLPRVADPEASPTVAPGVLVPAGMGGVDHATTP